MENIIQSSLTITACSIFVLAALIYTIFKYKGYFKLFFLISYVALLLYTYYQIKSFEILILLYVTPSFLIGGLAFILTKPKKIDELWDVRFPTNKGNKIISNLKRGVLIFGSAGSGKTVLIYSVFMKHFAKLNYSGLIYDFKNGELTELAIPLYGKKLKIVSLHQPSISFRVNPISPKYIQDEKDVNQIVDILIKNLIKGADKGDFFTDSASGLLSAVILKFYFDHSEICDLPHVIAFILNLDLRIKQNESGEDDTTQIDKLRLFLTENKRVAIQGSPFILGLNSPRQTASVISTLANALRKVSFPTAFYVLSGDEIDFNINDEKVDSIISVINEPKSSDVLSPLNATIIHTITKQMMVRNRKQSFVLFDEAPTIKLLNMAQIPATMRSFGVCTIYCAQDMVQGYVQYGKEGFKEIISNLSTQFFGKANDVESAKYYENYFEIIKEKTLSKTIKGSNADLFSNNNTSSTTGEKERAKYRAHEFTKLLPGQFAFLSDGNNDIIRIKQPEMITENIKCIRNISPAQLEQHYLDIIKDVENLIP